MVPTSLFVERMREHWEKDLGNITSEPLERTWEQIGNAFLEHVLAHKDDRRSSEWTVLRPPTGSGKTRSAIVYCALLTGAPKHIQPGVLIITRRKVDADQIAAAINELHNKYHPEDDTGVVARSYHTDNTVDDNNELSEFPVLVITHRAYEMVLEAEGNDNWLTSKWPYFSAYNEGRRKLVIIDEAIDLVEESRLSLNRLRWVNGMIPTDVREHFPNEITAIKHLIEVLESQDSDKEEPAKESILCKEPLTQNELGSDSWTLDFSGLRKAIKHVRFDKTFYKEDSQYNSLHHRKIDNALKNVESLYNSWIYYARENKKHTLNTARLILPEGLKGTVVLDATAGPNVLYDLFPAKVIERIPGTRIYHNATLYLSKDHRVGKEYMEENCIMVCNDLIALLNEKVPGRKVFIVTHKEVEPKLVSYETDFKMHVGHWGAIDGSNDWQDCDTVVIFGLPYRPDTWPANAYMAFQGVQDTEWLRSSGCRPFKRHNDIRQAIKTGQLVSDVVQAINRIRCRRVIDADGNCPPSDVFLLLPNGSLGDQILSGIQEDMPGIKKVKWKYEGQRKKPRRRKHEEAVLRYFKHGEFSRISGTQLREHLKIPSSTFKRILSVFKTNDTKHSLVKGMLEAGVRFEQVMHGKTPRIVFSKS